VLAGSFRREAIAPGHLFAGVIITSESVPEDDRRLASTESNNFNDDLKLALFEIVVYLILLCGLVATAHSPFML
jgi:hypothetical protein